MARLLVFEDVLFAGLPGITSAAADVIALSFGSWPLRFAITAGK